jgi:hypothetical protein
MNRYRLLAVAGLVLSASLALVSVALGAGPYAGFVTVVDVETATGMRGLTAKETGTTVAFFDNKEKRILEAHFDKPGLYASEVEKNPRYYEKVPGIGEKAAIASPGRPYRLTFVKGKYCVIVQSIPQFGKDPLTRDQLIAIGRIIAGRL